MRTIIENIIRNINAGICQDDELNDVYDFFCEMGLDLDDEYLLKCTDVEQANYYLSLFINR